MPGGELGSSDAKQWCVPWGYELNNISYNQKMFEKAKVEPPKNLDELLASAAKLTKDLGGPYGVGVRGSRSWATMVSSRRSRAWVVAVRRAGRRPELPPRDRPSA